MIKKKINEKSVQKFLLENPNFFLNNPEILNNLKFPKNGDYTEEEKIISYKDWIIDDLKQKQKSILDTAKYNFFTQQKVLNCSLKILKKKKINETLEFIINKTPKIFDLEVINLVTSNRNLSNKFKLIFKEEEVIQMLHDGERYLILDAVDDTLRIFSESKCKIYSNAIFSVDPKVFESPLLLVFGSKNDHFLSNKAFDLIYFFSKIIEEKLYGLSNEL